MDSNRFHFRIWHKSRMIYLMPLQVDFTAGFWTKEDDNYRVQARRDFHKSPTKHEANFYNHDDFNEAADGAILMQSTGLHDKNGIELFEDDIVQRYDWNYSKEKGSYLVPTKDRKKVEWWPEHSGFSPFTECSYGCHDGPDFDADEFEVIGNVHEHPHLLLPS